MGDEMGRVGGRRRKRLGVRRGGEGREVSNVWKTRTGGTQSWEDMSSNPTVIVSGTGAGARPGPGRLCSDRYSLAS